MLISSDLLIGGALTTVMLGSTTGALLNTAKDAGNVRYGTMATQMALVCNSNLVSGIDKDLSGDYEAGTFEDGRSTCGATGAVVRLTDAEGNNVYAITKATGDSWYKTQAIAPAPAGS